MIYYDFKKRQARSNVTFDPCFGITHPILRENTQASFFCPTGHRKHFPSPVDLTRTFVTGRLLIFPDGLYYDDVRM